MTAESRSTEPTPNAIFQPLGIIPTVTSGPPIAQLPQYSRRSLRRSSFTMRLKVSLWYLAATMSTPPTSTAADGKMNDMSHIDPQGSWLQADAFGHVLTGR